MIRRRASPPAWAGRGVARRLHRRDALDRVAGSRLLGEARVLADALRDVLADIQRAPAYRAAVAAHAVADAPALVRLLPEIFAGLEPEPPGADLFIPVAWLRRGRLRPPADVGAEIVQARAAGVPGEGDDVSPGADAASITTPNLDLPRISAGFSFFGAPAKLGHMLGPVPTHSRNRSPPAIRRRALEQAAAALEPAYPIGVQPHGECILHLVQ